MSIESDLVLMLKTNAAFSAVTFQFATDPQAVNYPKATLERVGASRRYGNDGDVGVALVNLQLNFIAVSKNAARDLAKAALATFDTNASGVFGSTRFAGIFLESDRDMAAPVDGGTEKPLQMTVLSIRVNCYDALS